MLHLHRATRADALVDALAAVLADPPDDPFLPEVVAVPTRGIERWIAQRLAVALGTAEGRGDGVCANVRSPSPARLMNEALAAASGVARDEDPWRPEAALWTLLAVLDAEGGRFPALAQQLERPDRRLACARHLVGLFDRYGVERPELLRAWAAGKGASWQSELWRALRAAIGTPSPAERLEGACARLREEPELSELPQRLSVFGLTRLAAARLQALDALAAHRDVHLHLLHPSSALWERLATETAAAGHPRRRADDRTEALASNRLLASWGQDARELQLVLSGTEATEHVHAVPAAPKTLLGHLQAAVHADREAEPLALAPDDTSLEVHVCHGRVRQVEVLRDALLHRLRADPTLELRDVIVLCPDIEAYAPLIHSTFGAAVEDDDSGLPRLPVRLADRALRQTNPVLGVVARLLELATARVTASDVLDLADRAPVRRRFLLDDDDLARASGWVSDSGVRWGLDAAARAPFGLERLSHGTWETGLRRVLLGTAMTEDGGRLVGTTLPLDDVPPGDIDLAGRVAELVERLGHVLTMCATARPATAWADLLAEAADLLCATSAADAWQRSELDGLVAALRREATGSTVEIGVAELRDLLADRLRGRPTRASFRTGALTFCTLHPMRAVPHRVVCLLGLDDDVFPRGAPRDGDDLMLADPHVGDRDGRLEDRQLLLDAVLSAQDAVVVTYSGRDERTNAPRPPAVPVGELLEAAERVVGAEACRERVVHEHPLQPFDPRGFRADAPWSFDRRALEGARALVGERHDEGPFLDGALATLPAGPVDLDELIRFTASPVKAFLRERLTLTSSSGDDDPLDALTIELDGLGKYDIGQRLVDARLAGLDRDAARRAEIARGTLPPGFLARRPVEDVEQQVERLLTTAAQAGADLGAATSLDVRVILEDGRRVTGTVAGIVGERLRSLSYATLAPKHRMAAWIRLLALAAGRPEVEWRSVAVGRGPKGSVRLARIGPVSPEVARAELARLVDLRDRGLREPLPLPCKTSFAYVDSGGGDPLRAARREWLSDFAFDKEDRLPEHARVWGADLPLEELLDPLPEPDEDGPGWSVDPSRFGRLAHRLWDGMRAAERVEDR